MPRQRKRKCLTRQQDCGEIDVDTQPSAVMVAANNSGFNDSWQRGRSLVESLTHALQTETLCDVTFEIGAERKRIQAHKLVLCVRSSVFQVMLTGPMAEQDTIVIPEVEPDIFEQFLKFLYTDDVIMDCSNVISLLYVSNKYDVTTLEQKCLTYLASSMTSENVCIVLEQAHLYNQQKLKDQALAHIWNHGDAVLESPDCVSNLCHQCFVDIIKSDNLKASEEKVFEFALSWSEMACKKDGREVTPANRRQVLGEAVKHVRYPTLAHTYFVKTVTPTELLTEREENTIYRYLLCPDEDVSPFVAKHRNGMVDKEFVTITRFEGTDGYLFSGCTGNYSQAVMFAINKPASLLGFQLYGAGDNTCQTYLVKAFMTTETSADNEDDIIEGSSVTKTATAHSVAGTKTYDVEFTKPISLVKDEKYLLIVNIKGPASHYGQGGKSAVQHGSFVCSFFNYQTSKQSVKQSKTTYGKHGQIPALLFLV